MRNDITQNVIYLCYHKTKSLRSNHVCVFLPRHQTCCTFWVSCSTWVSGTVNRSSCDFPHMHESLWIASKTCAISMTLKKNATSLSFSWRATDCWILKLHYSFYRCFAFPTTSWLVAGLFNSPMDNIFNGFDATTLYSLLNILSF